ncbi:MAG: cyclic lactone autoinducer peptide [Eubacteriales bacterium]|nr:cyclic lactone autoinducer peptide [Eubacteriales bacterium]
MKSKFSKVLYSMIMVVATLAVNSTCCYRFYQEELDPQLCTLKKHNEE